MDKAVELLSQIADKFGATGSELFKIYAAKIAMEGIADLLTAVILAVAAYLGLGKLWRMAVASDDMDAPIAYMILTIVSLILGGICIALVNGGMMEVLAPQGVAIERIVSHGK